MELKGKYTNAKIFTKNIEDVAVEQILEICNQEIFKNSKIRIMPDVHVGKGCVIGFTAEYKDKIIPNIIGVDIGCGMLTVNLGNIELNLKRVDKIINENIPSGFNVHKNSIETFQELKNLKCHNKLNDIDRIEKSIGTLGGGNHFIEINTDKSGNKYLVIHTGSRNLGTQVAKHYQDLAFKNIQSKNENYKVNIIKELKEKGKENLIQETIKEYEKNNQIKMPKELCYLEGNDASDYLNDMKICQEYAKLNRETIADIILANLLFLGIYDADYFHTIHNYIDLDNKIMRKGSISAELNQKVLIPINMRDGSILAVGKGNKDWNNSAPHGAGRLMGREEAKRTLKMEDFKNSMANIYTTSICESTLDEAPMAYKSVEEIIENTKDTIEIIDILKPIYNFKSSN